MPSEYLSDHFIFTRSDIISLLEQERVLFAYLFGSYAIDNENTNSDIDIAVFLKEDDFRKRFNSRRLLIGKLSGLLNKSVDIVVLNDIENNFLLFDILHEGKVIFDLDEGDDRFAFETTRLHRVLDFLEHIKYDKKISN